MIMREMALPRVTNFTHKEDSYTLLNRSRRRWLVAFFFSALVGAALGITGMTISALASFHFFEITVFLDRADTVLIAMAFPIIVFAAHCLDNAEEAKKAIKANIYKQQ